MKCRGDLEGRNAVVRFSLVEIMEVALFAFWWWRYAVNLGYGRSEMENDQVNLHREQCWSYVGETKARKIAYMHKSVTYKHMCSCKSRRIINHLGHKEDMEESA